MTDISKYDLKTIKLKPITYNKLIKAKAHLEFRKEQLHSFDSLIDHLIENYMKKDDALTNNLNQFPEIEDNQKA